MPEALTDYRIVPAIITGPPRWGEQHVWQIVTGPGHLVEQFTSRRDALDALAELVNEPTPMTEGGPQIPLRSVTS